MTDNSTDNVDVIVIGGGLAGLAAAATATRAGRRVLVLEARSEPGGRARTTDRDGYLLDEGAHALYRDGEGLAVLRSLGIEPTGGVPVAKGSLGVLGGRLGVLPSGPVDLVRSRLLGPRAKLQVGKLLGRLSGIDVAALAGVSYHDWATSVVPDPAGRRIVDLLVRTSTYSVDFEHLSAGAAVMQAQRAMTGSVLYVDGGWTSLVDGLRSAAITGTTAVRTGVKVDQVQAVAGGIEVRAAGEVLSAPTVVVAVGGSETVAALLDRPTGGPAPRPCSVAALEVCLPGPWGELAGVVLGVDEPIYLSVHAPVARVAPDGASLVSLMKYLRPGQPNDPAADRRQLEGLFDLARPGMRARAVHTRFSARLVAATDLPQAAAGGLPGRPGVALTGTPGVFIAGDWVGPVGVLADASLASGAAAGRLAAERVVMVAA